MSRDTLATAFKRQRPQLDIRLEDHATTETAIAALRAALERLDPASAAAPGEDRETTPNSRRQLAAAVDLLRAVSLGTLAAVRAPAAPPQRPPRPSSPLAPLLRLLPLGLDEDHRHEPPRPPRPTVHTPTLLDQLQAAAEAADRLLAEAEPPAPERVPLRWSEDRDVLNLLRDLLSAHAERDGELALRHIDRLRKDLVLRHDIAVVDFDGTNDALFSFVMHPDPGEGEFVTSRPALVAADGRVLRPGEVRGPARTQSPAGGNERGTEREDD
ncbi:hypothetical protein AF335_20220 [Streptomyces eurocidicus]|uniref:Uncharacterized protein n=1 Tax=Streptomyces eurocidicus TaxID=66423 RepID=A0A2N8NTH6_STREU|nr:hypothetical protein [Streptomyces eurocidicus]MBB5121037.1 hypothetical protein [Streptomyces eurocidicus]MBF6055762.1 hypothetical protein [Streptomyces eurocidicus]PNE32073.1 hypothetical protein AF335_20220 [Streptomyces eurocidicus]